VGAEALPREYRIKAGRTVVLLCVMTVGILGALAPAWSDADLPGPVKLLVSAGVVVFLGWLLLAASRCVTTVDVHGIRIRTLVRTRRLAWADIQEIRAVPNPGAAMPMGHGPKVIVYAYRADGRRVRLMYVDDIHVAVHQEVAVLRAAWADLRGADWRPGG
jgi:hypothetical protein